MVGRSRRFRLGIEGKARARNSRMGGCLTRDSWRNSCLRWCLLEVAFGG